MPTTFLSSILRLGPCLFLIESQFSADTEQRAAEPKPRRFMSYSLRSDTAACRHHATNAQTSACLPCSEPVFISGCTRAQSNMGGAPDICANVYTHGPFLRGDTLMTSTHRERRRLHDIFAFDGAAILAELRCYRANDRATPTIPPRCARPARLLTSFRSWGIWVVGHREEMWKDQSWFESFDSSGDRDMGFDMSVLVKNPWTYKVLIRKKNMKRVPKLGLKKITTGSFLNSKKKSPLPFSQIRKNGWDNNYFFLGAQCGRTVPMRGCHWGTWM